MWLARAELAAAVAEAGGIGFMTALSHDSPDKLRNEISKVRGMTDKPFGINLTFLPSLRPPDFPAYVRVCIEEGVRFIETAGRNPVAFMPMLNEAGIKVIHKCTSIRHALTAQRIGCAAVSIDGFECAWASGRGRRHIADLGPGRPRHTRHPYRVLRRIRRWTGTGGILGIGSRRHEHGHAFRRDRRVSDSRRGQAGARSCERARHAAADADAAEHCPVSSQRQHGEGARDRGTRRCDDSRHQAVHVGARRQGDDRDRRPQPRGLSPPAR